VLERKIKNGRKKDIGKEVETDIEERKNTGCNRIRYTNLKMY
jgi:hypothetical protein